MVGNPALDISAVRDCGFLFFSNAMSLRISELNLNEGIFQLHHL